MVGALVAIAVLVALGYAFAVNAKQCGVFITVAVMHRLHA